MDRRRRLQVLACLVAWQHNMHLLSMLYLLIGLLIYKTGSRRRQRRSLRDRAFVRLQIRREVLDRIIRGSDENCVWELRMSRNAFAVLCDLLHTRGGLVDDGLVTMEAQVAVFVHILAHNEENGRVQARFGMSGEAIDKCVLHVMRALFRLHDDLFAKPEPVSEDCTEESWKLFKNCLGALDGTHIAATVPEADKPRYRTWRGHIATNVLGACTRDLKFMYVLAGWEGSASESRVLRDAVTRRNNLKVPDGQFYLVDAGYTNSKGFLAPYKGERYNLQEWSGSSCAPRTHEEYFNMKHAQARNVIERCFGLLRKRWSILRSPSFYPIKVQGRMVLACCLLHNFIRMYMPVDPEEFTPTSIKDKPVGEDRTNPSNIFSTIESTSEWTEWRDALSEQMFDEWRAQQRKRSNENLGCENTKKKVRLLESD